MRKFFLSVLLAASILMGEEYKAEAGGAPPAELAEIGKRLKAIDTELAEREERWLELSEALQALDS